jgi:hypothetical protein
LIKLLTVNSAKAGFQLLSDTPELDYGSPLDGLQNDSSRQRFFLNKTLPSRWPNDFHTFFWI